MPRRRRSGPASTRCARSSSRTPSSRITGSSCDPSTPRRAAAPRLRGTGMRVGIVTFPGSNCDHDVYHVVKHACGADAAYVWHKDRLPSGLDVVIVPGGFSYGDYLRCGALARFSPVMEDVLAFAGGGGPVLGICNGFQILCEAGLLPGVLLRNASLKFICQDVLVEVEGAETPVTAGLAGERLAMPIAHAEGNYFADAGALDRLEGEGQVVFRYAGGAPNGSA